MKQQGTKKQLTDDRLEQLEKVGFEFTSRRVHKKQRTKKVSAAAIETTTPTPDTKVLSSEDISEIERMIHLSTKFLIKTIVKKKGIMYFFFQRNNCFYFCIILYVIIKGTPLSKMMGSFLHLFILSRIDFLDVIRDHQKYTDFFQICEYLQYCFFWI